MSSLEELQKETPYSTRELVRDIAPILSPVKGRLLLASFARVLSDIAWLYPAYALASLTTFFTTYHPGESIRPAIIIMGLFSIACLVRFIGAYYAKLIGFGASEEIKTYTPLTLISHMFRLDISWHEHESTGNKMKKIIRGADSIDTLLRIWIGNIIEITVNLIGITLIIGNFDRTISILTLIFLVTYYILSYNFIKRAATASRIVNAKEEDVHGLLFESIANIRTVKVLGMGTALGSILKKESVDLYRKVTDRIYWFQTGNTSKALWARSFQVGIFTYIIFGIAQGRYEVGFLILFYAYFSNLLTSVAELSDVNQQYVIGRINIGRMMEVLHTPITIDKEEGKIPFPQNWKTISFKKLSFAYGKNKILKNISFTIKRGERVGIVGLSGAGKSTLFKLLLKEHEDYTGDIFIDDIPLSRIRKSDYFNNVATVLQDTEVFNFSLKENITLANIKEARNEKLFRRALTISHVSGFLHKLPHGADTLIGEKGIKLSGGEHQRLGIACAVFKNPQILLLDEATSHLDIESEENIRASLHDFFQEVTAVVIAHRLTTIKEMDRIIIIENGTIIEEGNFDELHTKKGRFFELWEKQKL